MTQASDIILSPNISGTDQRTELNDIIEAVVTGHSGAGRPAYLDATLEGVWVKEVSGTVREIYYWDKAQDILQWTIDTAANTAIPAGSSIQFGKITSNKTGAFSVVDGDCGTLFTCDATSASFSASLAATAGLQTGWFAIFQKTDSTANTVTIDPDSTNTVNGATTLVLSRQYDAVIVIKIGSTSFAGLLLPNGNALAPLASPALTGNPTAPTQSAGNNSTRIATTAYADSAVSVLAASVASTYAPLASPALTGNPTAPTQTAGNNSTRLATTAFVTAAVAAVTVPARADASEVASEANVAEYVSPDRVKNAPSVAKAFGSVNWQSSGSVYTTTNKAYGCSLSQSGGALRVTFSSAMPDANYVVVAINQNASTGATLLGLITKTTGYFDIASTNNGVNNYTQFAVFTA